MTADDLRARAKEFRTMSAFQADGHKDQARTLATKLTQADELVAKALAGIHDCMSRRYRQWADHLDAVANEIDELGS